MQIDAERPRCPLCRTAEIEWVPVLHHMICAYVGPEYDFGAAGDAYRCPKCCRMIVSGSAACEIVGTSARCAGCGCEVVVSQPPR